MSEEIPNDSGANEEAAAPVAEQHHDEQADQQERNVPLSALESERSQRQQLQDELKIIKEHLSLIQARQTAPPPQEELLSEDDVMTYGDFKKMAGKFQNEIKMSLGEMQMTKQHPDYEEVVRKYLPEVIAEDPDLANTLRNSQDFKLAYRLAKSTDSYRRDHQQQKQNADATRLMDNSQKAGSLSSVGGTSPISMAKRYKDMSDKDFREEMAKNLGYV